MSDNAPSPVARAASKLDPKALVKRRVLGVPVLYLIGVAVAVLAFYAWKLKPSKTADPGPAEAGSSSDAAATEDVGAYVPSDELFPTPSTGTVVVAPQPVPGSSDNANSSIDTNAEWLSRSVAFLVAQGVSGGAAQAALQTYLGGGQLSSVQGSYRDQAIREFGLPPDPVDNAPVTPATVTGYVRRSGTAALYRAMSDGTLDWIDRGEWDAAGQPNPTDIPATDPIWNRPVSGGPDAPEAFKVGMG